MQVAALLDAIGRRKRTARDGDIEVEILSCQPVGDNAVRVEVRATRAGRPIAGFDPDQVIVNPPYDFVEGNVVREDPLACLTGLMLEYARRAR